MAKLFDPTDFGFDLSEQQKAAIDAWDRFRKVEGLDDHVLEWDRSETYPEGIYKTMGKLGFFGQWFPEEYGGLQSDDFPVSERDVATLTVKMCEDHPTI